LITPLPYNLALVPGNASFRYAYGCLVVRLADALDVGSEG
jgi:hypothetical protein